LLLVHDPGEVFELARALTDAVGRVAEDRVEERAACPRAAQEIS
jgi:hypothetical protein